MSTNKQRDNIQIFFSAEYSRSDPLNLSPRATFKARFPVELRAHDGVHKFLFLYSNIFNRADRHSRSFDEANIEPDVIQKREGKYRPVQKYEHAWLTAVLHLIQSMTPCPTSVLKDVLKLISKFCVCVYFPGVRPM